MNNPQEVDPAAFERVWRRVMPQDRADCPIVLNTAEPSAPADAPINGLNALAAQTMPSVPAPLPQPCVPRATEGNTPALCLGEGEMVALPILAQLMEQARAGRQIYTALSRPSRGQAARTARFRELASVKEGQLRRLRTAYFLIAGTEPEGTASTQRRPSSLSLTLRERYHAEQSFALACLTAVAQTADPCLTELYRSLAGQSQALAGQLRELLEEMG